MFEGLCIDKDLSRVVVRSIDEGELSDGDVTVQVDWSTINYKDALAITGLPAGFTPRQAMAIGTAGYTAMLCIPALEKHGIAPGAGGILVTGAGGGLGGIAIALLAKLGYRVTASTGKLAEAPEYARRLLEGKVRGRLAVGVGAALQSPASTT
jgi:NADPH:quinone reductase-like Zn-dependent oxidoreductase